MTQTLWPSKTDYLALDRRLAKPYSEHPDRTGVRLNWNKAQGGGFCNGSPRLHAPHREEEQASRICYPPRRETSAAKSGHLASPGGQARGGAGPERPTHL